MLEVHRAGDDRPERHCGLSAATLEGTGVVMTMITAAAKIRDNEKKQIGR
jgi:hypothetical protein